ncbi:L30e-like protein [Sanghuangporus baumii]|uniref:H/ACA ribonucleoprotein complex subunit 2 n=1 Tax=Sanghuangporus baumii TaxID=108892 RepID=A0A9Q5N8V6_SANBA|nr:L30e-like protein [Sanghuangporus baumii]
MGKSEKKEHKKRKDRSDDAGDTTAGDISMAVSDVLQERPAKKSKKEKDEVVIDVKELSPIARPLAERKLLKKLHKVIKKASKQRQVKRGVKEVVKGIRKGEKGLLVLAADITPIDIISHLPVFAEDERVPYVFIPSKEELGRASATKRPTSCVMVCPDAKKRKRKEKEKDGEEEEKDEDYRELYDECCKEAAKLQEKIFF